MAQVPLVDYLRLGEGEPHLVVHECQGCGARYFDRRNACARCTGDAFERAPVAREGVVVSFSIVSVAPPGLEVPFVAVMVDCGGTLVKGNLRGTAPEIDNVRLGLPVRLTTYSLGVDPTGAEGVGFAFVPADAGERDV
ncbi:OB-fold domain-containing protein [Pseudonocardia ailaonensis]|uniref:OB-fold domain-containing protein n=1 Tax=Pseudonocardia ailaonensis TaxID=367279 RepID=UPI0031D9928F